MEMVSTSIKVDKETWREFKIECIKRDVEMSAALTDAIAAWVKMK